jgi:hypothetical protein
MNKQSTKRMKKICAKYVTGWPKCYNQVDIYYFLWMHDKFKWTRSFLQSQIGIESFSVTPNSHTSRANVQSTFFYLGMTKM